MHTERDRRLNRALSLSAFSVATGSIVLGGVLFFFFPRFSAGYLGRASFSPSLMSGFTGTSSLAKSARSKRIPRWSCAYKQENRLLTTGCAGGHRAYDFRRLAVEHSEHNPQKLQPSIDGWIYAANPPEKRDSPTRE